MRPSRRYPRGYRQAQEEATRSSSVTSAATAEAEEGTSRRAPAYPMAEGRDDWLWYVQEGLRRDKFVHWRAPRSKAGAGFCDLVIWFALSADLKSFVTLTLSPLFDFLFQL